MQQTCKNCTTTFAGIYCNMCGEKVMDKKERSLTHYLEKVFSAITFADTKFLKTFWLSLSRPGLLSRFYVDGVRVRYFAPLSMFMLANLIYFLFQFYNTFDSSFNVQTSMLPYSQTVRAIADAEITSSGVDRADYILKYNMQSTSYAKLFIILFVMTLAAFLSVIYYKKDRYYTDHLTLAFEFGALLLFVGNMGLYVVMETIATVARQFNIPAADIHNNETTSAIAILLSMLAFYYIGRNFYQEKRIFAFLKAFAVLFGIYYSLMAYRLMLFFVTFYSI